MPTTGRAHLHDVRGIVVTGALEFGNLLALRDETTVLGQTVAEDVREEHHVHFFADLALCVGGLTEILGCTNEFRVRIAHRVTVDATTLELVDESATRESVVDDTDITAQHVDGETHGPTRYF